MVGIPDFLDFCGSQGETLMTSALASTESMYERKQSGMLAVKN